MFKISIITAVYNRKGSIAQAIESVTNQTYSNIEHVIIDGASTDGTTEIIKQIIKPKDIFLSEPDKGIYDALNKGLQMSTGEVIGLVHSDDFLANERVLSEVAKAFSDPNVELVYGDLDYVSKGNTDRIIRHWKSTPFNVDLLKQGWMPAHPTVFIRRSLYEKMGGYNLKYPIAADYDWCIRYLKKPDIKTIYIPRVLVKMRVGGESNGSILKVVKRNLEIYSILRSNNFDYKDSLNALVFRNLSKVRQYIS